MSRWLGIAGFGGVAAAAYAGSFAGATASHQVVSALPMAQVEATLARSALPPLVFGETPVELRTIAAPGRIDYLVRKDGAEVMRFVAALAPAGDGTRVDLSLVGAESGRFGNVRERLERYPDLANLYLKAMRERIASDLEARDYDLSQIYAGLGSILINDPGLIADQLRGAGEELRRRDRENIEKAYADEARGIGR